MYIREKTDSNLSLHRWSYTPSHDYAPRTVPDDPSALHDRSCLFLHHRIQTDKIYHEIPGSPPGSLCMLSAHSHSADQNSIPDAPHLRLPSVVS